MKLKFLCKIFGHKWVVESGDVVRFSENHSRSEKRFEWWKTCKRCNEYELLASYPAEQDGEGL